LLSSTVPLTVPVGAVICVVCPALPLEEEFDFPQPGKTMIDATTATAKATRQAARPMRSSLFTSITPLISY
jgi:hypothetical protein